MNVALRVDASVHIGTGHFMRCLTLARALQRRGGKIRFISRHIPEHLRNLLKTEGHEFAWLNGGLSAASGDGLSHAHWLGTSQHDDAQDTIHALSDRTWDWLIVDHYAIDYQWERRLRGVVKSILVIDDLADRQHDCDVLLDQNVYINMDIRYVDKVPSGCELLLGPRYALLREEFREPKRYVMTRSGPVQRLLVTFGGIDAANHTGAAIEALVNLKLASLHIDVVIGAQHPVRERIATECVRFGFSCHLQTSQIAQLMARADLAVGACGFTAYELLAMQVPAILVPANDIQLAVARELSARGVAYVLLTGAATIVEGISGSIMDLMESDSRRLSMSLACRDFIDVDGVGRVIGRMFECENNHA